MAIIRSVKFSTDVVEAIISGDVSAYDINEMAAQAASYGRHRVWLISAEGVTDYDPFAINAMGRALKRLERECGLGALVAVVTATRVRMGASLVAALVRMPVKVVRCRADALGEIRSLLR